jgi:hypothetical protein
VKKKESKSPWPESASELYKPSDRPLSAMLVPIFADIGCQMVIVTDSYGSILGFLDLKKINDKIKKFKKRTKV